MKKDNIALVITSIQYPTKTVEAYALMEDVFSIIVADLKTPLGWECKNTKLLSVDEQKRSNNPLAKHLPWNHYSRKILGYLYAMEQGYDIIYDTDDDNLPKDNWYFPKFSDEYHVLKKDLSFVNVYQYFTQDKIWPRGFPLRLIRENHQKYFENVSFRKINVGIWQGLADLDPDVDAIYRLVINKECFFDKKPPLVFDEGTICPFNTQNTFYKKEVFPLLYIPSTVSFRYCDILRGLVAQPILWAKRLFLGFFEATVTQERNIHDYMKDFESEIPIYTTSESIVSLIMPHIKRDVSVGDNLFVAYKVLYDMKVVSKEELTLLELWLKSCG